MPEDQPYVGPGIACRHRRAVGMAHLVTNEIAVAGKRRRLPLQQHLASPGQRPHDLRRVRVRGRAGMRHSLGFGSISEVPAVVRPHLENVVRVGGQAVYHVGSFIAQVHARIRTVRHCRPVR